MYNLPMSASASEANQIHTDIQHVLYAQEEKIEALNNLIKDKDAAIKDKDALIIYLQDALQLANARQYGRSSERYADPNQTSLFDEAELEAQAEEGRTFDNETGVVIHVILGLIFHDIWVTKQYKSRNYGI